MPSNITRRHFSPDIMAQSFPSIDASMKDATPLLNFEDANQFPADTDQMIFGPLDMDDHLYDSAPPTSFPVWDPYDIDMDVKPSFNVVSTPSSFSTQYDFGVSPASPTSPTDSFFDSNGGFYPSDDLKKSGPFDSTSYLSNWINDPDMISSSSPSSPIVIPSNPNNGTSSFLPFIEHQTFPIGSSMSPTTYAANLPLPASVASSPSFDEAIPFHRHRVHSISPGDMTIQPGWASQMWDNTSTLRTHASPTRPSVRHSPLSDVTVRQRIPSLNKSVPVGQIFQSSSAPSPSQLRAPSMTRSYSRRIESMCSPDDRDATVRRKKRVSIQDEPQVPEKSSENPPLKSVLRPPKLAPSAWQLYFTDWISRQQASNTRKLNVAQAAKEAGQEYASLTPEEKEPYKRKSQALKESRERELAAYMKTLSPDDIKRENAFRTAQRKLGKSRKSNIKDPNAPKKPLSAYFMFLQRIRANPSLVQEVFGDETETTKQSVLAAAKWRSMSDDERKPFLAQAEQEKMEYEAARRLYEEGPTGYGTSINFSILPNSPAFGALKLESESESEGFVTDDGHDMGRHTHS